MGLGPERMEQIESLDPTFHNEMKELRIQVHELRQQLANLFEAADSSDEDIRAAVERIIEARSTLERRVTEHLLVVRTELTAEQQKRLFDICAEGLRGGPGKGWGRGRGGRGHGGGRGVDRERRDDRRSGTE